MFPLARFEVVLVVLVVQGNMARPLAVLENMAQRAVRAAQASVAVDSR
jgi:hypothetical protein